MCFIEKMNCIKIRKREYCVPDPVRTPGRVGYWGVSTSQICFIYTLKLGVRGRLSMLTHSPQLQFITRLLDSPKTEAKGVVLVEGPWYETPFDLN